MSVQYLSEDQRARTGPGVAVEGPARSLPGRNLSAWPGPAADRIVRPVAALAVRHRRGGVSVAGTGGGSGGLIAEPELTVQPGPRISALLTSRDAATDIVVTFPLTFW